MFDYTCNAAEEITQGLKQLIHCSDDAEQTRLLTLAPRSWRIAKVEAFFHFSERQARYGVFLSDSGPMLYRPVDLREDYPIENETFERLLLKLYRSK